VTGFGLLGAPAQHADGQRVSAEIDAAAVPLLPKAVELAETRRDSRWYQTEPRGVSPQVTFAPAVAEAIRVLLFDAQTSGGLLIAVDNDRANHVARGTGARRDAGPRARIGRLTRGVPRRDRVSLMLVGGNSRVTAP